MNTFAPYSSFLRLCLILSFPFLGSADKLLFGTVVACSVTNVMDVHQRNALADYGCLCGSGTVSLPTTSIFDTDTYEKFDGPCNKGKPVDATDTCCQVHDNDWSMAEKKVEAEGEKGCDCTKQIYNADCVKTGKQVNGKDTFTAKCDDNQPNKCAKYCCNVDKNFGDCQRDNAGTKDDAKYKNWSSPNRCEKCCADCKKDGGEEEKKMRFLRALNGLEDPYKETCDLCSEPPKTYGDPHFKTWSGQKFDYHGECDLVLLQNANFAHGLGLRIHIRTEQRGMYSFISDVAIQIGNDNVLEVTRNGAFYYNGQSDELPPTFAGFPLTSRKTKKHPSHYFDIHLNSEQAITIKSSQQFMGVVIDAPSLDEFAGSVGLFGSYPEGYMLARDGRTILTADEMGPEWQVQFMEPRLFQVLREPQHPQACIPPPSQTKEQRRLGQSSFVNRETAEATCHNVLDKTKKHHQGEADVDMLEDCIFDVLATGSLEAANESVFA